jgi:hypothetical protein
MDEELRPYTTVRVGFDMDYLGVCDVFSHFEFRDRWCELGDLLAHRVGWHFDIVNSLSEILWSYGAFTGSLLNISLDEEGRYACFDYDRDDVTYVHDLSDVAKWIDEREPAAKVKDTSANEMLASDDWRLLRGTTLDLDVSWSDAWYEASVSGLPADATFGRTLAEVVINARQMVADSVGAPEVVIPEIRFRVHLNSDASSALVAGE